MTAVNGPTPREQRRAQRRQVRETERQMAAYGKETTPEHRSLGGRIFWRTFYVVMSVIVLFGVLYVANPTISGTSVQDRVRDVTDPGPHGPHAFFLNARNGGAVGWDPCQPIRYVVNPEGAPDDWQDVVDEAVDLTSKASGYTFEDEGTTEARPLDDASVLRGAPLLISWADGLEVPELKDKTGLNAVSNDVAGVAYAYAIIKKNRSYFVSGVIALDTTTSDEMTAGDDADARPLVLAHELGHILGLDHVDDPDQLMNPVISTQQGFGDGDREGLRELHDVPCA